MKGADEGPGTGIDCGLRNSMDWESRHGRVAGKLQRSIPRVDKKRENECGCRTQHHLLCYRTGKAAEPPVLKPSREEGSHPGQHKSLNGLGLKHTRRRHVVVRRSRGWTVLYADLEPNTASVTVPRLRLWLEFADNGQGGACRSVKIMPR